MGEVNIVATILSLISGIGIFLVACNMMSSNLETVGSEKLKRLFSRAAKSKWLGVGIGAGGTAAIQSSGATTVMVIGFVNAGIMTLFQAATIVFGANIGTTITGHIVALSMFGSGAVSTTMIFSALAGVGAFMVAFAKKDTLKTMGGIITGFGMLFVGLSLMSGSMESFAALEGVRLFLARIDNAILLVLIGAGLTAVIQSSSVMTSIAITMVATGLISLDQGIFITMGSNIGSCIVAVIAGLTSSRNAKRTAVIHLMFNVGGVVLFMLIGLVIGLCSGGAVSFGSIFERLFPNIPQTQLAMFHTVFNVIAVLVAVPLTRQIVALSMRIIPEKKEEERETEPGRKLYYIDDKMLVTPPIAVAQVKNEIINMAEIAMRNFSLALDIICRLDYSELEHFRENEKELNYLNKELVRYLVKLSNLKLSEKDHTYVSMAFHNVSDLERVGDYAENIVEYADTLRGAGESFSEDAVKEITDLKAAIEELFGNVMKAYIHKDMDALKTAEDLEDRIDDMTDSMSESHIKRLNDGTCTATVGAEYLSLSSNAERVADHFINVANTVKESAAQA